MTTTNTLIRAAEIWVPSPDGWLLEFSVGAFGGAIAFAAMSREMCFGRDEGLPGRAWEEARPLLLASFSNSYFRRTTAAHAAGLHGALAIPYFTGDAVRAVLVLFCGNAPGESGVLELWRAGADGEGRLALVDGSYGTAEATADAFRDASRSTTFGVGEGLPGRVLSTGNAGLVDDLGAPQGGFVRHEMAAALKLVRGLSIPLGSYPDGVYVATCLATNTQPLAKRIERWTGDASGLGLRCVEASGGVGADGAMPEGLIDLTADPAFFGTLADAWTRGVPSISDAPGVETGPTGESAQRVAATGLVALPLSRDGAVVEVLALYL